MKNATTILKTVLVTSLLLASTAFAGPGEIGSAGGGAPRELNGRKAKLVYDSLAKLSKQKIQEVETFDVNANEADENDPHAYDQVSTVKLGTVTCTQSYRMDGKKAGQTLYYCTLD